MIDTKEARSSVCVFCGSSPGNHSRFVNLATETGKAISARNLRLVYGGGGLGLMGASARAAHESGGKVLGIIPDFLLESERAYKAVEHRIVPNMHDRKMMMFQESNAFIILPGGIGTLEEAVEVISWMRLDLHQKPIVFVCTDDYWDPMISLIDHIIDAEFAPEWMRDGIFEAKSAEEAMTIIEREWKKPKKSHTVKIETSDV